jgi:uncharacterized Fe-S center protein
MSEEVAALTPLSAIELSVIADKWFDVQKRRLAADKVAAALKSEEESFKAILISQFQLQKLTGIGGKLVRVGMDPVPDYAPHVMDWDKYRKYIIENDAWELVERRPGRAACKERWDQGVVIPGCEKFPIYKLTKQGV